MESASLLLDKVWLIRVDPNEDLLESINKFVAERHVSQGVLFMGYGTLRKARLHWVKHDRLPPAEKYREFTGGIEILSMNGVIVDGKTHIHIALSTPEGAFGGHLEKGSIVYVLCEIAVASLKGGRLRKELTVIGKDDRGQLVSLPQLFFNYKRVAKSRVSRRRARQRERAR